MRDILLTAIIGSILPFAARFTWIGILLWTWISIMSPHRLTYGFAFNQPWGVIAAAATLISLLLDKDRLKFPWTPPTIALILFVLWMCLTTVFALYPDAAREQLVKVLKIQAFTLIAFAAIRERKHIEALVWVLAVSIGFYGVKGGAFVIRSGGGERVWGPEGSYIEGNNEVGLAIIMVIPLLYYLRQVNTSRWVRMGLVGAMVLCAVAAIGTYSRGALLAIAAMGVVLWWRSKSRLVSGIVIGVVAVLLVSFMPESWEKRMNTIGTYEQDGSAQGRLNAWTMAFNLANDRLIGAGYETATLELFAKYAPIPEPRAAHSIYFQILGEHGWIGLALFLSIGFFGFITAARVRKLARGVPDGEWLNSLAAMIQVSMVGFAVGGTFLSLAYFDLQYDILVVLVACERWIAEKRWLVEGKPRPATGTARDASPGPLPGGGQGAPPRAGPALPPARSR